MLNLEGEVVTLPDNIMHGEVCPIKTQVCLNNLQVMGFRRKITRSNPAAGPLKGGVTRPCARARQAKRVLTQGRRGAGVQGRTGASRDKSLKMT